MIINAAVCLLLRVRGALFLLKLMAWCVRWFRWRSSWRPPPP